MASVRAIVQAIADKSPECRLECEQLAQLIGIRLLLPPPKPKPKPPAARADAAVHVPQESRVPASVEHVPLRVCTMGGESFDVDGVPAGATVARVKRLIGAQRQIANPLRRIELFSEGGEERLAPESTVAGGATTMFMCLNEPPNDRAALGEIFRLNGGGEWPAQKRDGWASGYDVGLWAHVTADEEGNVTRLDLGEGYSDGHITQLPESIGQLGFLAELSLNGCRSLRTVPAALCKLANLRSLDLRCSGITHLPDALADCPQLKQLRLTHCNSLQSTVSLKAAMKQRRPACDVWWPN